MAMSQLEKDILKALAAFDSNRVSIESIAQHVGCKPETIYRKLQSEEFKGLFLETLRNSLSAEVPLILESFASQAKAGSFKHGKLLLEIAGLHKDEQRVVGNINLSKDDSPFAGEEERRRLLTATLTKLQKREDEDDG